MNWAQTIGASALERLSLADTSPPYWCEHLWMLWHTDFISELNLAPMLIFTTVDVYNFYVIVNLSGLVC